MTNNAQIDSSLVYIDQTKFSMIENAGNENKNRDGFDEGVLTF